MDSRLRGNDGVMKIQVFYESIIFANVDNDVSYSALRLGLQLLLKDSTSELRNRLSCR